MIHIINENNKPQYNLALEEYAVKHIFDGEDILILWQNEPSVIIGRNQNAEAEINKRFIQERNINVVRRPSGGGAVYHDFGNLCFTFITKSNKENANNFRKFTDPVIRAINKLGVEAKFEGRNDIVVEGKKVSGNAQYYYKDVMLHHGTVLFDANIKDIVSSLNVSDDKITSKSIQSVRSRVENISHFMKEKIDIKEFMDMIKDEFSKESDYNLLYLTDEQEEGVKKLIDEKYSQWEWNFGKSPKYEIKKERRYPGGKIELWLNIKSGKLKNIQIFGDFFAKDNIYQLEEILKDNIYNKNEISSLINSLNWEDFFYSITKDEFIDCMFM